MKKELLARFLISIISLTITFSDLPGFPLIKQVLFDSANHGEEVSIFESGRNEYPFYYMSG